MLSQFASGLYLGLGFAVGSALWGLAARGVRALRDAAAGIVDEAPDTKRECLDPRGCGGVHPLCKNCDWL